MVDKELLMHKLAGKGIKLPFSEEEAKREKSLYAELLDKKLISHRSYEFFIKDVELRTIDDSTMRLFKKVIRKYY